jgi:hypothetical protein
MRKALFAFLFEILLASPIVAQNWSAVQASKIQDAGGNLLASGSLCFQGTNSQGQYISFQAGGGGQVLMRPVCTAVSNGGIGTFQVPNPANTLPQYVEYEITVKSGAQTLIDDKCVQFTGSPFNFDNYTPTGCGPSPLNPISGYSVNGNLGVNGNLSVTGSVTGGSGLGNNKQVIDETTMSGSTWAQRVNTANTAICTASGSTGGVINALAEWGGTIDQNVTLGASGCAVELWIGMGIYTEQSGVGFFYWANSGAIGRGIFATAIAGNGTSPMMQQVNTSNQVGIKISNMTVGNFVNTSAPVKTDMALYFPQVSNLQLDRLNVYASYGFFYGSYVHYIRQDITLVTGCNCEGVFTNSQFTGWVVGAVIGWNANSNHFIDDAFGGSTTGTSVYIDQGAFSNEFSGLATNIQVQNIGWDIYGQATDIDGSYTEGVGIRAGNCATSTAYLGGMICKDSNGGLEKVVFPGTTGGSAPTWPTVAGGQVTTGTVTFQYDVNTTIILEQGSAHTMVRGSLATTAGAADILTYDLPIFSTNNWQYGAQFQTMLAAVSRSNLGQQFTGGLISSPITLQTPPNPVVHYVAGSETANYYYYWNLNSLNGSTGLSSQVTVSSAPNTLGQAEAVTAINSGGTGYAVNDTVNESCTLGSGGSQPQLKVTSVGTGGVVTGVSINSAGSVVFPGNCSQASTSGSGTGLNVAIDVNYIFGVPPQGNATGFGTFTIPMIGGGVMSWDWVGRTNSTSQYVSLNGAPGGGYFWTLSNAAGFIDIGQAENSYTVPNSGWNATGFLGAKGGFNFGNSPVSFSSLPACNSTTNGWAVLVTNVSGTPTYLSVLSSGSATYSVLAVCYPAGGGWLAH